MWAQHPLGSKDQKNLCLWCGVEPQIVALNQSTLGRFQLLVLHFYCHLLRRERMWRTEANLWEWFVFLWSVGNESQDCWALLQAPLLTGPSHQPAQAFENNEFPLLRKHSSLSFPVFLYPLLVALWLLAPSFLPLFTLCSPGWEPISRESRQETHQS